MLIVKMSIPNKRKKISDLAGTWKMSDEEVDEFMHGLRKGWKQYDLLSINSEYLRIC